MNKYTTHTYEITFEELMEAVRTIVLKNDPAANIHLGTINSTKWLELDSNKGTSTDRKEIKPSSTVYLSIEMDR
jgi:hypothetical protein